SSYQLIGFLRGHLVDVLAQLVHALNVTQKAISHRGRPVSRLRLRCRDLSCLLCYRKARGLSRSSATRGVPRPHRSQRDTRLAYRSLVTDRAMEAWYHPPWHEWPPTGGSHGKPHRTTKILSHASRWRRAAWICVRSRYAEPRRWGAAFRS